jgi:Transposase DDE domain
VEKQKELDGLFTQVLAALSREGLITLEQVMQDGTKIKAQASTRSFQREGTIQGHLQQARQRVAEMGDPRNEETSPKAKQAQARARREQQTRLEHALEELQKLKAHKSGEKAKSGTRVSTGDPQARVMKQSDGGLALSYNAQISTDATHGLIVGVAMTQEANDSAQLLPAVDRMEERLKKKPRQMVADGGYTTRDNIEKLAGREIDFLGSMRWENVPSGASLPNRLPPSAFLYQPEMNRYVCPEGKVLHSQGRREKRPGLIYYRYEARAEDCQTCIRKPECCPDNEKRGRSVARPEESPVVIAFRRKMASEEAQAQYRRRGRVVEFCHAWIKSKLGLRQFHVRGLAKVQMEMLWAYLTYNLQQWIRLSKPLVIPAAS